MYFALVVCALLCVAGAALMYYEPIGLPVARTMAGRWGDACNYDHMCPDHEASRLKPEPPRGFLGSLFH